jgi:hypothetical protein
MARVDVLIAFAIVETKRMLRFQNCVPGISKVVGASNTKSKNKAPGHTDNLKPGSIEFGAE